MLCSACLRAAGRHLRAAQTVPRLALSTAAEFDEGQGACGAEPGPRKVLRAAILGLPNAGKTTLVNQLLGRKLFAVSPKRHTTTRSVVGVFTEGDCQIILMDTPGVVPYQVGRKLRAPKSFLTGPQRSMMEAELVVVVVDVTDKRRRESLDNKLMKILAQYNHIPAVLLLNKVDAVKQKHILLSITESIIATTENTEADVYLECDGKWDTHSSSVESFDKVFMVSALTGDGVEDLRGYLTSCAHPGEWEYSVTEHSDQTEMALVEDIIREKLFLSLHQEIPYVLTQSNVVWEKEGDTQLIYQNLTCRSSKQASIVIGPGGRTIQAITAEAKTDIETLLGCPVDLTLNVKSQK